jgi:hypothetical protein
MQAAASTYGRQPDADRRFHQIDAPKEGFGAFHWQYRRRMVKSTNATDLSKGGDMGKLTRSAGRLLGAIVLAGLGVLCLARRDRPRGSPGLG